MKGVISKRPGTYAAERVASGTTREVLYGSGTAYHLHYLCNWDVPMHRQLPQLLLGAENGPFGGGKGV